MSIIKIIPSVFFVRRHPAESDSNSKNKSADCVKKKKSAYSLAPNRVHCKFCYRSFPWASSLRRHTLTHTGQKPYKCSNCPLLFTTKSNCDRHFLRKHRSQSNSEQNTSAPVITTETPTKTSVSPTVRNDRSNSPSGNTISERPFKCTHCPTSKFPTFENLKKHIVDKHGTCERIVDKMDGSLVEVKSEDIADNWSENNEGSPNVAIAADPLNIHGHASSDLPFKCHLCDRSFGERQETLDHINDSHNAEYRHLIDKGALDSNVKPEETINQDEVGSNNANSDENNAETNRVRFPDYSSRKVRAHFLVE